MLSLTTTVLACENPEGIGEEVPYEGGEYEKSECDGGSPVDTVEGTDARQEIYFHGDEVPDFEGDDDKPWKNPVREIVNSRYPDLIDGDRFDFGPDEVSKKNTAIIVTRYSPGNYTVALFQAADTDPPSTCSSAPPSVDLDITPTKTVETGESVDIEGAASADDSCPTSIDGQEITIETPSGDRVEGGDEATQDWTVPGEYTITYEVTDDNGGSATATDVVVVTSPGGCEPTTPVIEDFSVSETTVSVGESVEMSGEARDGDSCGSGLTEKIRVDGEVIGSDEAIKNFGTPGSKTIEYEVTDNEGNTVTTDVTIQVNGDDGSSDDDFVIGVPGNEVVVG